MSTKNLIIFETTYDKVLAIINKVKDFIKNNTKNFENLISELDWVKEVIIDKTLYSYEVNKEKISEENQKFLDFITKYNEEIISLNKKHVLVRDILSMKTNKEFLQKPSLILKKMNQGELTELNYNEDNKKKNKMNPLGSWILNLYYKNQEENSISKSINDSTGSPKNKNIKNLQKDRNEVKKDIKSYSEYKIKKTPNKSLSLNTIINQKKVIGKNKGNKMYTSSNKYKTGASYLKNKYLNLSSIKKTMERYFINEMELKRKKNIKKYINDIKDFNYNNNDIISVQVNPEYLNNLIEKHFDFMKSIIDKDFNIFKLKKLVGYNNVLPLMCHFMFKILGLIDAKIISVKKFIPFLTNVSRNYIETTLYHNSMHGADVCHSLFLYIINSNLEEICETSVLDLLGLVVSATGHDLGHPGYNNNFLVNSNSDLALNYNDISCLENFHTSTLFKILRKDENNIFENMDINNYKHIRKRIVNQILATDMINHAMVLSSVKAKIDSWEIDNNNNEKNKFFFLSGIEKSKFDEQQMLLNFLIHAADLGHNTQKFFISIQWVELLTQEFWNQGDIEREKNLKISFLCDRNNVDVPNSQVGFLKGFILNTFDILVTMFPSLDFALENSKDNVKEWQKLADEKRRTGWTPKKKNKDKNKDDNENKKC